MYWNNSLNCLSNTPNALFISCLYGKLSSSTITLDHIRQLAWVWERQNKGPMCDFYCLIINVDRNLFKKSHLGKISLLNLIILP